VTHATLEGKYQCVCVCAVPGRENCEAMDYSVSVKTELLEVKVTIEFHRQCHKNLISARCVSCSGRVATINVMVLTSKFLIVVSGSKYT
jgi:hypothetical protein